MTEDTWFTPPSGLAVSGPRAGPPRHGLCDPSKETREIHLYGPPGTGKTTALSQSWIVKAVARFGAQNVVVCSMTKAAAYELASRLGDEIPRENVGTLHSICFRGLRADRSAAPKLVSASDAKDWNAEHPYQRLEVRAKDGEDGGIEAKVTGDGVWAEYDLARHRQDVSESTEEIVGLDLAWREFMDERNLVDFTGMIERGYSELDQCPGYPDVLIVDEAQDLSRLELALVRKWGEHCTMYVLAGDPDQCIYTFRGATATAFMRGPTGEGVPTSDVYKLTQSYRVPRLVQDVAQRALSRAYVRSGVDYKPRDVDGEVYYAPYSYYDNVTVDEIVAEAARDPSRRIMVAAHARYLLNHIMRGLRDVGVPWANPGKPSDMGFNPLTVNAERLARFIAPARTGDRAWTWSEIAAFAPFLRTRKGDDQALLTGASDVVADRVKQHGKKEADMADLVRVFSEPFLRRMIECVEWQNVPRMCARLARFALAKYKAPLEFPTRVAMRDPKALTAAPNLWLGTIHSFKGMEADTVYLIPDISYGAQLALEGANQENHDSVVRTFYVGMTRAKERLVLMRAYKASFGWPERRPHVAT